MFVSGASTARAQRVGVTLIQSTTRHSLVHDPDGYHIELGIQLLPRVEVRGGYERTSDSFQSEGTTCSGLVNPDADCDPETRDEQTGLNFLTATIPFALVLTPALRVSAIPGVRIGSLESRRTGHRTGRRLNADMDFDGFDLGVEADARPFRAVPVRIVVGWQRGVLWPESREVPADGYSPFVRDIWMSRWRLGAAYVF